MTTKAAKRKSAIKAASRGELGFWQALRSGALDVWHKDHKKFESAVLAFVGDSASLGFLHGQAQAIVTLVITALGAAGVHVLPNERPDAPEGE